MKKGYYLKYGITSKDISQIVNFIESKLGIKLSSEDIYDDELYILEKKEDEHFPRIDNLTIYNNYGNTYFKGNEEIENLEFLISCNIISGSENLKEKSLEYIREKLSQKMIELEFDSDEWE